MKRARCDSAMVIPMTAQNEKLAGDQGFILIAVLWLITLLALLSAGFLAATRSYLRHTANSIQSAKAEAVADAGVQLAALTLAAEGQSSRRWPVNGTEKACAIDDHSAVILRIQDASGLISINLAGERLLQALFIGLGATREAASRATDLIIDYRDDDNDSRPKGAEQNAYEAADRPQGPKNAPFDTIEELNQVLGLDPAMIAAATPYITVHSETAGLDPRVTLPSLTALLSRGFSQLLAKHTGPFTDDILYGFATSQFDASLPPFDLRNLPAEFASQSLQKVFHVTSQGHQETGADFVRETVIDLKSLSALPVFKMWRRGVLDPSKLGGKIQSSGLAPC